MHRRTFLSRALQAGTLLPLAGSGLFARPLGSLFLPRAAGAEDRVLVLINLNGGNDGLNTVVPVDNPIYYNARPSIAIAKSAALPIGDGIGLHPSMGAIQALYNEGDCAIVQSVGYPDQNRSHFRSTDIWHTASKADEIVTTGWIGRYLENSHPEYPDTLPSSPFAIQIASSASLALQGVSGGMGLAIDNPDRFYNLAKGLSVPEDPIPATLAGPELAFVRDVIEQSNQYSTKIQDAMEAGSNGTYQADSLSTQLKVVARLINGGLKTGVYIVTLGGFDTHIGQINAHGARITQLNAAVGAFMTDITGAGNGDRVALMTYSEFGRRVNENGSAGTDHGAASPQFIFGRQVLGGKVIGGTQNLTDLDSRGDIKFVNDFRQIYASVLRDWLGYSTIDTARVLGGEFPRLDLFTAPTVSAPDDTDAQRAGVVLDQNRPNPVLSTTTISFTTASSGRVGMFLYSSDGRLAARLVDRTLDAGRHSVDLSAAELPAGAYTYILETGRYRISRKMIVVR